MPDIFTEWAESSRSAMDGMIAKLHEQARAAAEVARAYSDVAQAAAEAEGAIRSATEADAEFNGGKTGGAQSGGTRSSTQGDAGFTGGGKSVLVAVTAGLNQGVGRP